MMKRQAGHEIRASNVACCDYFATVAGRGFKKVGLLDVVVAQMAMTIWKTEGAMDV